MGRGKKLNEKASVSDWYKKLAAGSIMRKKRKTRKRAMMINLTESKKCSSTVCNISWTDMKRERSKTSIKRTNFSDFPYPFDVSHNTEASHIDDGSSYTFVHVYQRRNKAQNNSGIGDQNGGQDGLETQEASSSNKDQNDTNNTEVLAPPTPNCGMSLIDILKNKCWNGPQKISPERVKMKRHKPKVFFQKKITKTSTPKPKTPKQRREKLKKTTKKVKRKLDFDDNEKEMKLGTTNEVEPKPTGKLDFDDNEQELKAGTTIEVEPGKLDFDDNEEEMKLGTTNDTSQVESKSMDNSLGLEGELPTTSKKKRSRRHRVSHWNLSKLTIEFNRNQLPSDKDGIETKIPDLNPKIQDEAFKEALLDFLVKRMDCLHIDDATSRQVALIDPSNSIVAVDLKRKRKKKDDNKAKIDLDKETIRVWDLLKQNKWSESAETEGTDDPEYMKGQRKIFREKVDTFLARMHVIQGDRTFSAWKGSVLDSIVGVFLTQNVSDNLSSNAFMDLASVYPALSLSEQNSQYSRREYQALTLGEPVSEKEPSPQMEKESEVAEEEPKKNKSIKKETTTNWDELRTEYSQGSTIRTNRNADSVNWERIRQASLKEIASVIAKRGMNNQLAEKIKGFLDRLVKDHGNMDLEWLRDVPPEKAKDFLLSVKGLGLKSTECVRLLSLHCQSFPIDTNAGRFFVRVGWVPIKPLPGGLEFHLLDEYPLLDSVQVYMWPRICDRDTLTLYDLHCHSIAFSKTFCTKTHPKCNECPMRRECKHYASAFASAKGRIEGSETNRATGQEVAMLTSSNVDESKESYCSEPIVQLPTSPEPEAASPLGGDIEDVDWACDIPTIRLDGHEIQNVINNDDELSRALVALSPQVASIPMPQIKFSIRLRTAHQVYELPDFHPLLTQYEVREPEDPCPYLLAIWPTTGETANTSQALDVGSSREVSQYHNHDTVKGTILIPCRTANRGRFPLNGTYFQNNEVFADHEGSIQPIDVPREWIWNLTKRTLYCGTTITSICRGMSMEEIAYCFRRSYICIRGFSREKRKAMILRSIFHVCRSRKPDENE